MKLENQIIERIENLLPPIVTRANVGELTEGLVAPKTLANADAAGDGPEERAMVANKIVYSKDSFLKWLAKHLFKNGIENSESNSNGEDK